MEFNESLSYRRDLIIARRTEAPYLSVLLLPSETIGFEADVPMPSTGKYILQLDLISEGDLPARAWL